jgi:hypothetical protein
MPQGALSPSTFPHDLIRLACERCGRRGQYRRSTIIRRFGADASMPDVLRRLAACERAGNASDPCGVRYPDLVKREIPGSLGPS